MAKRHVCPFCGRTVFYRRIVNGREYVLWLHPKDIEDDPNQSAYGMPLYDENYRVFIELLQKKVKKWLKL
jgi:hypothetical protein